MLLSNLTVWELAYSLARSHDYTIEDATLFANQRTGLDNSPPDDKEIQNKIESNFPHRATMNH